MILLKQKLFETEGDSHTHTQTQGTRVLVPIQSRKAARLESLQPWQSPRVQKLGVATACPHPMANRDVFLNDFHDSV